MFKILSILLISFVAGQSYPVSDLGDDQRVEQATEVVLSAASSYSIGDGNSIVSYVWTVNGELKEAILSSDSSLSASASSYIDGDYWDIVTDQPELTFTAPEKDVTETFTVYLKVVDINGLESREYGAETLIISEYSDASNSGNNRYVELYNGTGETITSEDWQSYELWLSKKGANFLDPDQDFFDKIIFWRDPVEADLDHGLDEDEVWSFEPPDLNHGETFLIIKSAAASTSEQDIREHTHVEVSGIGSMNGDDGIALIKDGFPIDVVGVGDDPGSSWEVANGSTADNQLVRKPGIATGNFRDGQNLWQESAGCTTDYVEGECASNADDSEWIVLDPVCSNSDFDNEVDCESRLDGNGSSLEECHRVDEEDISLYGIDLDGDGEISESECDASGYKWADVKWLDDDFSNAGFHNCTACKNFMTLTVEVFPIASINPTVSGFFDDCNVEGTICEGDIDWDSNSMGNGVWDEGEVIRSESFELVGSGDKDLDYGYDWVFILGGCFDGGVDQNIYEEVECLSLGHDWKYYSWLNFCRDANKQPVDTGLEFITEQECTDLGYNWSSLYGPDLDDESSTFGEIIYFGPKTCLGSSGVSYDGEEQVLDENGAIVGFEPVFNQDLCNYAPYCFWDITEENDELACQNSMVVDGSLVTFESPRELNNDVQEVCFSLTIEDTVTKLESTPLKKCINVGNLTPIARAGEDDIYRYSVVKESSISIDASKNSYDPNPSDIESLTYIWSRVSDNSLDLTLNGMESETLVISGFPNELESNPIVYTFELQIEDQAGNISDTDIINVEVAEFSAPDPPQLYVVSYSDHVKLSWGFESEQSIDPLTKYADFEGYKLYRSEDGGQTWCPPSDIVYDFNNNAVACRPLYQMDLTKEQDEAHCVYSNNYESCEFVRGQEISGYDPTEPWIYLGDNSGVPHVFYDYGVVQGKEYVYTLTAFDMGVRAYELGYVPTGESSEYTGEEYTDSNENSKYDDGEPYIDCGLDNDCNTIDDDDTQGNGVWDGDLLYEQAEVWDATNPDKWTAAGRSDQLPLLGEDAVSIASMENDYGEPGDVNYVEVTVGDLSSNVTDPKVWYRFVQPHPDNVGNGPYSFDIMDRSLAEDVVLRFEIQAEYEPRFAGSDEPANSFESNKTFNPTLYAWEVTKACSKNQYLTQTDCEENDGDWNGLYGNPVYIGQEISVENLSDSEINYHLDFPGVSQIDGVLYYPDYLDGVENKEIVYYEEDTESNWTDPLYGTRFIFNNNYLSDANTTIDGKRTPLIQEFITHEKEGIFNRDQIIAADLTDEDLGDSGDLYNALTIFENNDFEIYYQGQESNFFDLRPPYKYMIEFSDIPQYKVDSMDDSDVCSDYEEFSRLPFRIKNIVTDQWVKIKHMDLGIGAENDPDNDGRRDCFWTRSEKIELTDYVRTYDEPGLHLLGTNSVGEEEPDYSYEVNLDFFLFSFFGSSFNEWQDGVDYPQGSKVFYQSMNWVAENNVPNNIPPPTGSYLVGQDPVRKGFYDCGEDLKCNNEESGDGPNPNDPNNDDWNDCGSDGDCATLDDDGTQNNDLWDEGEGTEGDGFNDNPWRAVYPWEGPHCHDVDNNRIGSYDNQVDCEESGQIWFEGDRLYFSPIAWYTDGDAWTVDMGEVAFEDEIDGSHFSEVRVVPNPYRAGSTFAGGDLHFEGLPSTCVIKIYTITGKLIKTINRNGSVNALEEWDVTNDNGDKIAPGLYIYHVKSGSNEYTGKFSIVR